MPNWTPRERRDHDSLKDESFYRRAMYLNVNPLTMEMTLVPYVLERNGAKRSITAPIVPLSVADAENLIADLRAHVEARKKLMELNP